jgi:hypothetical protein
MSSAERQIIERCGWCGVQTALVQRARHNAKVFYEDDVPLESVAWVLYECVSCNRPTLREEWDHAYMDETSETVLLPAHDRDDSSLPPLVGKAWEAALAVRNVEPNAFAVLVGRTLEVICLEEGAAGATLVHKLKSLAASGRIPDQLADMADKLREIRNLGAHASPSDEVKQADVPVIFEFADAILEYLYRAPAKIEAVEARLSKRPAAKGQGV